jgi:sugar/nucleoside kinase (ribokinase family)
MKQKYDVVVIGGYCLDYVFTGLPSMPVLGAEIVADGFSISLGGSCNAAIAMHRLGLKVGWIADFGSDIFSRIALAEIEKEGVDTSLVTVSKKPRKNITVALSYPGDRAFIAYYDPEPYLPSGFQKLFHLEANYIYINHLYTGLGLGIQKLLPTSTRLFMDTNSSEGENLESKAVKKAIHRVSFLSVNGKELRQLSGRKGVKAGIQTLGQYCPFVIVKDGKHGSYAFQKGSICYMPAIQAKTVDTTGAGDCFNAGFIKGLISGKTVPECLLWGNIVGGLSTEGRGALEKRVTEGDIQKWLKKNINRSVEWL